MYQEIIIRVLETETVLIYDDQVKLRIPKRMKLHKIISRLMIMLNTGGDLYC